MSEPRPAEDSANLEVASLLAPLGGVVLAVETVQSTVELVTQLAAETVSGSAGAGVTLVDPRGRRTTAASDPFVSQADALQYAANSGPCLTAWQEQTTVRVDDLSTETQWPDWTAAAAALGVRSVLSVPLTAGDTSVGAIKVYARQPYVYGPRAEEVLILFAQRAAVLLANMVTLSDARRLSAELTGALHNRDIIGQAKGVLIAQGAENDRVAFAMLVNASQRSNLKLHEVAGRLLTSITHRRPAPGHRPDRQPSGGVDV